MLIGSAPSNDLIVRRPPPAVELGIQYPEPLNVLNLDDRILQLKFSSKRKWTDRLRGDDEVIPHVFNLLNSESAPLCDFLW